MARKASEAGPPPELTGADAPPEQAEFGSAGNGADPFEADLSGTSRQSRALEPEADASDIRPDQVEAGPEAVAAADEEEGEPSARPTEWPDPDASRLP